MNSSALRIGEVALRAGVSIDTVRYYERRRLLPAAARTEGGFRLFTSDAVERVRFIKQAQELGFSLDEIGELLTTGGAEECRRVRDHLKVKLSELDERIRSMRNFRKTLARHLGACERELSRHLRIRVGLKEKDGPIPLCYCFGISEQSARKEIAAEGHTTIPQRISALIKERMCACEERNPSGACCLGEVAKAVKRLMKETT